MIPYLNYYKKIKSIPTLNIADISIKDLYQQRFNFYFKLGISEADLENKSVLEFCPGTGYNAYYLIKKCRIKNIQLVDHNPASVLSLKKHLYRFTNAIIINKDVNKYYSRNKFDFTIIENALSGFKKPKTIFKRLLKFTNHKGTLVCTFVDPIGVFSEKLRYLISLMLLEQKKIKKFKDRHLFLTKVFKKDLKYLSKNTRPPEKWVLDNLMNEEWMKKKTDFNFMNINDILNSKKYIVKRISPNFYFDYGWYKRMTVKKYNTNIIKQYREKKINFLDFETRFDSNFEEINNHLKQFNKILNHFSYDKKLSHSKLNDIKKIILKINKGLINIKYKNKVSLCLDEFTGYTDRFLNKKKINYKSKFFYKFWGIGTQAISIYKL